MLSSVSTRVRSTVNTLRLSATAASSSLQTRMISNAVRNVNGHVRVARRVTSSVSRPTSQQLTYLVRQQSDASTGSLSEHPEFSVEVKGKEGTKEWRVFFFKDLGGKKKPISPWHDIPLFNDFAKFRNGEVNFVCEIPKGTRAKHEISTTDELNPIKQDIKNGELRSFKYGDIPFNYGALPQTFEDPNHSHKDTGFPGDKDPVDVVEVSGEPIPVGKVVTVRVLGVFGLIDEKETDWKILCVSLDSPLASKLYDSEQIQTWRPELCATIRDWFTMYKTAEGKPQNSFAYEGRMRSQVSAMKVIQECHDSWKSLVKGELPLKKALWVPPKAAWPPAVSQKTQY